MNVWIIIPSIPKYFANIDGEILGPRGKLTLFMRKGYLRCQAAGKQRIVSRLVCEAFNGPPPTFQHHAAHRDNNRSNNNPNNLYWATPQQNADDAVRHGSFRGENHPGAKLTKLDVLDIKRRRATGESIPKISLSYPGLSQSTLYHASNGRNWSEL